METTSQRRREIDSALKERFGPSLREIGFKGSYPHFRRLARGRVEIVGVQSSQWGQDFYVELSIGSTEGIMVGERHVEANQLKHYHGWPRIRLGDIPFDYSQGPIDALAERVSQLTPQIDAWFGGNEA